MTSTTPDDHGMMTKDKSETTKGTRQRTVTTNKAGTMRTLRERWGKSTLVKHSRVSPSPSPVQSIKISDAAAARAFIGLSEEAARLVLGMLRVVMASGVTRGSIGEAVATTTLSVSEASAALSELVKCGLMRPTPDGTAHRLHPLLGSVGHRLHEMAHAKGNSDSDGAGNVLTFAAVATAAAATGAQ